MGFGLRVDEPLQEQPVFAELVCELARNQPLHQELHSRELASVPGRKRSIPVELGLGSCNPPLSHLARGTPDVSQKDIDADGLALSL